jgi:hypothetical protein
MARKRRAKLANLSPAVREYVRVLGHRGGTARSKALTPRERSAAASRAVSARWKRTTKAKRSAVGKMLADARAKAKRKPAP